MPLKMYFRDGQTDLNTLPDSPAGRAPDLIEMFSLHTNHGDVTMCYISNLKLSFKFLFIQLIINV